MKKIIRKILFTATFCTMNTTQGCATCLGKVHKQHQPFFMSHLEKKSTTQQTSNQSTKSSITQAHHKPQGAR